MVFETSNLKEALSLINTVKATIEAPGTYHFTKFQNKNYLFRRITKLKLRLELEGEIEDMSKNPLAKEG